MNPLVCPKCGSDDFDYVDDDTDDCACNVCGATFVLGDAPTRLQWAPGFLIHVPRPAGHRTP